MKGTDLLSVATRKFGACKLALKKHSPEILMVTAGVCFVGTVVLACKETLKAEQILDEHTEAVKDIHTREVQASPETLTPEAKKNFQKETVTVYVQTAGKFIKLYSPSILLGTVTFACAFGSHKILKGRYLGMVAAYQAVDTAFANYRENVRTQYGEEADLKMNYTNNEDLKEQQEEARDEKNWTPGVSCYARLFDEFNDNWTDDPSQNAFFLRQTQAWANKKLKRDGYLFLNDVYKALGFQATKAGCVVGWLYEPNAESDAECIVDFMIMKNIDQSKSDFINGIEPSILLDFNVAPVLDVLPLGDF